MSTEVSTARRLSRRLGPLLWLAIIATHVIGAAIWWAMMPAGFPLSHPRFWLHRVVPVALASYPLLFVVPRAAALRPALLVAIPATYIAAAVAGRLVYPITLARLWLLPLAAGLILLALWAAAYRARWRSAVAIAPLGMALGAFLAIAHAAPPSSTHPANPPFPGAGEPPASYTATFAAGAISIDVYPVLTFISRSPDGCWTALWPQRMVAERSALTTRLDERGTLHLESLTAVAQPVYTHLNSYTTLAISGHRRLFLAFSPAPDARIEVLPADYPSGRPARFAYVDPDRTFRIVQASDAEKGPFTTLASGTLAPDAPISITLYDEDTPVARITFDDFAAQASTELSPTAGWSVPQNAIELRRSGDAPSSFVDISLTLAGTSVGRGFDSVGHAPGVYRNRMRLERL